jgi:copper chaperone CopZ
MIRFLKLTVTTLAFSATWLISPVAYAENISITVKGMVCSFCAQGIKKTFERKDGVEKVEVDLDKKIVTITSSSGATISDNDVRDGITNAGYEVLNIERVKNDK